MTSAANLYSSVIQDVVTNVRDSFLDEAVDENVLQVRFFPHKTYHNEMRIVTVWQLQLHVSG
jgi:hypothetical protein